MTIDWMAKARRVVRGRRSDESPGSPARPLSEGEIREAEAELGVTFPDEYAGYLFRQNGGGNVNPLCRTAEGWRWEGDTRTNYDLLATDFPHPDSYRDREDELDAREPMRGDFSDDDAYGEAWKRWDDEYGVLQDHKTSGAVVIQENGCGFSTLLVVTGPHRGTMWFDARATCDQILPLKLRGQPMSFTDWLGRHSMELLTW
ncbi:SMI1/KNR4 family protein [Streptomyces sp. NPDC056309]|uniref:SMI1/KNR4 family protein n=1 Tax=unclassified Streptomyces TaxID=2593676 RepID=UPI0035E3ABC9